MYHRGLRKKTKLTMLKIMFYGVSRIKKFTASVIWRLSSKVKSCLIVRATSALKRPPEKSCQSTEETVIDKICIAL